MADKNTNFETKCDSCGGGGVNHVCSNTSCPLYHPAASVSCRNEETDPVVILSVILENILNEMRDLPHTQAFWFPVSAKNVPDYHHIVDIPMDLQTMKEKLHQRAYTSRSEFVRDVNKIAENSKAYNGRRSPLTLTAVKMLKLCTIRLAQEGKRLSLLERLINPLLDNEQQDRFSFFLEKVVTNYVKAVPESWPFHRPVNRGLVNDHHVVIKNPTDVGTILKSKCGSCDNEEHLCTNTSCSLYQSANHGPCRSEEKDAVATLSVILESILDELRDLPDTQDFWFPVSVKDVPCYYNIVRRPMDLETMREKLHQRVYTNREEFLQDVDQILENSNIYNGPKCPLSLTAQKMVGLCVKRFAENEERLMCLEKAINPLFGNKDQVAFSSLLETVTDQLKAIPESWPFHEPVPENYWKGYYDIIKNPIDLDTIQKKAEAQKYHSREDFQADLELLFENSQVFHGLDSPFTEKAKEINEACKAALEKYNDLLSELEINMKATLDAAETDPVREITGNSAPCDESIFARGEQMDKERMCEESSKCTNEGQLSKSEIATKAAPDAAEMGSAISKNSAPHDESMFAKRELMDNDTMHEECRGCVNEGQSSISEIATKAAPDAAEMYSAISKNSAPHDEIMFAKRELMDNDTMHEECSGCVDDDFMDFVVITEEEGHNDDSNDGENDTYFQAPKVAKWLECTSGNMIFRCVLEGAKVIMDYFRSDRSDKKFDE